MLRKIALVASLVAVFALAGTAFSGNNANNGNSGGGPNKSSSSSISLVLSSGAATSATSGPYYGDAVTFNVSTTETAYPFVNLQCYQNGALVAEGWAGVFAGALVSPAFGLSTPVWTGGAADCTAYLDINSNGKWKQLASTSFHVAA